MSDRFPPELVERVARAIYSTAPMWLSAGTSIETMKQIPWEELRDKDRQEGRDASLAALEAAIPPGSTEDRLQAAERVIEAARELHDFLHKTVGDSDDAALIIKGDDLHAEAVKDRLQRLHDVLRAHDEACGKEKGGDAK